MKSAIFLVLAVGNAFAQAPVTPVGAVAPNGTPGTPGRVSATVKTPVPREMVLELQFAQEQAKTESVPFQELLNKVNELQQMIRAASNAAMKPMVDHSNELIVALCALGGISEADTKAQQCDVNFKDNTVSRLPAPGAPVQMTKIPSDPTKK